MPLRIPRYRRTSKLELTNHELRKGRVLRTWVLAHVNPDLNRKHCNSRGSENWKYRGGGGKKRTIPSVQVYTNVCGGEGQI